VLLNLGWRERGEGCKCGREVRVLQNAVHAAALSEITKLQMDAPWSLLKMKIWASNNCNNYAGLLWPIHMLTHKYLTKLSRNWSFISVLNFTSKILRLIYIPGRLMVGVIPGDDKDDTVTTTMTNDPK